VPKAVKARLFNQLQEFRRVPPRRLSPQFANPDQAQFFPYLTGYVAFYDGDYKTAITELRKASQEDPFILILLAQSYEKVGDAARAKEYYGKVMANNGHGPTNAFARPVARKKLAGG